jgi:hypothetical protein
MRRRLRLIIAMLMKLAASRAIDLGDVERMLTQADDDTTDAVRVVVRRYLPDGLEDFESLVGLARLARKQQ